MKITVAALLEQIEKIDNTRQNLLKIEDITCHEAANLLWDYKDILLQTKVEV